MLAIVCLMVGILCGIAAADAYGRGRDDWALMLTGLAILNISTYVTSVW